jgi:hypothetical protein
MQLVGLHWRAKVYCRSVFALQIFSDLQRQGATRRAVQRQLRAEAELARLDGAPMISNKYRTLCGAPSPTNCSTAMPTEQDTKRERLSSCSR